MKKLLLILSLAIGICAVSYAQTDTRKPIVVPEGKTVQKTVPVNATFDESRFQASETEQAILNRFVFAENLTANQQNLDELSVYIRFGNLPSQDLEVAKRTLARIKLDLGLITSADYSKFN